MEGRRVLKKQKETNRGKRAQDKGVFFKKMKNGKMRNE